MKKLFVLVYLSVLYSECNSHGHISGGFGFGGIVTGIHDRVQSGIKDVADLVLGGLGHGVKVEYGGTADLNNHRPPPPPRPPQNGGNTETVVVIIEEEEAPPNQGHYKPPQPPRGNGNQGYNNNVRPGYNGYNRPHNGYQQQNNGYNRPDSGYNTHNGGYNHQNNGYNNGYNNQNPGNSNQNNGYFGGQNQHRTTTKKPVNVYRPKPNNQYDPLANNQYNENNESPKPQQSSTTTTTTSTTVSTPQRFSTEKETTERSTVKYDPDKPFFVPLHPNEYTYDGEKINVSAPKRETDLTKEEEENGEGVIDVRFGDK